MLWENNTDIFRKKWFYDVLLQNNTGQRIHGRRRGNCRKSKMKILVTGGAGYIGSHTCLELLNHNYEVVVLDNFCNSSMESIRRVEKITGKKIIFYEADMADRNKLNEIFEKETIDAVIHFAGLKAVGESVSMPLEYFINNISGTLTMLDVMRNHNIKNIVFSSSATVYGTPETVPIKEEFPLSVTNPYGRTKLMLEEIFRDLYVSDNSWNIILLRYFNPIGAHESGLIGEDPNGIPNNLLPYITKVSIGELPVLHVFGDDYDTPDGTCIRDYIHVVDLARGHVKAIEKLAEPVGVREYNLGTGNGYSVLEVIRNFEAASGVRVPYEIAPRRPGDVAVCYADAARAKEELGFMAEYDIRRMCEDSYRWQKQNPKGYKDL